MIVASLNVELAVVGENPAGMHMESEQSEKKPKKKQNSGFLTLNPRISNIPQETQILWKPNNNYQLSYAMFSIQTHCCPILFIGLISVILIFM